MALADENPDNARELLPWHAGGTLDEGEAAEVRRALDDQPELRAEAEQVERLLAAVADDVPVPMLTHDRIAGVMSKLDAEPQEPVRIAVRARHWWSKLSSRQGHWVPAALAAALGVVAILVTLPQPAPDDGVYTTLSSSRPAVAIQVSIGSDLNEGAAQALFESYSLNAERQGDGSYVVTLPDDAPVSELQQILEDLRADGRVADARVVTDDE